MTLTGTWLLPIAVIPGVWDACEVPGTPWATRQQITSQPRPSEADDIIHAKTQRGDPRDERALDKSIPGSRVGSLQEHGQNTSKNEASQDHPDPGPSASQTHPKRGYPDPVYSNSGTLHCTQSQYPPRAFFIPVSGCPIPADGCHRPTSTEYTSVMHEPPAREPKAPPPVVLRTVPLPDAEPRSQR